MAELKAVLWTGGNAPNRNAELKVTHDGFLGFCAYWEPGYCGCPDCHPIVGVGKTAGEAIAEYWEIWEEAVAEWKADVMKGGE